MLRLMALTDEPEELLDTFDENDQKIGTVRREETVAFTSDRPPFIRASELFITNDNGDLWVPRRVATKKIAPNGLDFSAAEHVLSGETYEQAMIRGLLEELRMNVAPEEVRFLGVLKPSGGTPCFRATFVLLSNATPDYNRADFSSAEWIKPKELMRRLKAGENAKRTLLPGLELFLAYNKEVKE